MFQAFKQQHRGHHHATHRARQRHPQSQGTEGVDFIFAAVDFVQAAIVVGRQLFGLVVAFVIQLGIAHDGGGIGHLLQFAHLLKACFVFFFVGQFLLAQALHMAAGGHVVAQDIGFDVFKHQIGSYPAQERREHPGNGNFADFFPTHHI